MKIIMCKGLPGSGKSTWAKKLVADNDSWIRVNKDDIRAMIGYRLSREGLVCNIRNWCVITALASGKNVVVDDTNFHPKHEKALKSIAEERNAEFEIKSFDTPIDDCIKNDLKRPVSVGERVIRQMHQQWIRPNTPRIAHPEGAPAAIICDLDGTLANLNGRNPYNPETCDEDLVNNEVLNILFNKSFMGHKILFVSGREDEYEPQTLKFLNKTGLTDFRLFMRKTGDSRKDWIIKKEIYEEKIAPIYDVRLVLDDRKRVVDMWRDQGLTVWQVADGDF